MEMSKNLRRALDEQRFSVAQLAELSGVPRKTIYHWLNGQKPRNVEQLLKVCRVLSISVEQLFRDPDEVTAKPSSTAWNDLGAELNAGYFEVILRPLKRNQGR